MENQINNKNNIIMDIKPEVYTVEDIQKLLNIGRKQAYELANSGKFPAKKLQRKILIPRRTFDDWLYS